MLFLIDATSKLAGLLNAGESLDQTENTEVEKNKILPKDLTLNYYEKIYANEFQLFLRAFWAYSFMIVKVKYKGIYS